VYVANVYRQDLIWKGYTGQLNFIANFDGDSQHYDKNGFITRPAPIGDVRDHYVQAYYIGWTGDGHIGWLNIDHAFYQVFGEDSFNGIAGRPVEISAQMAALELSVDKNWMRHKLSGFYVLQGFNLGGTSVNFKQPDSLVPDFRTSKTEAHLNSSNSPISYAGFCL